MGETAGDGCWHIPRFRTEMLPTVSLPDQILLKKLESGTFFRTVLNLRGLLNTGWQRLVFSGVTLSCRCIGASYALERLSCLPYPAGSLANHVEFIPTWISPIFPIATQDCSTEQGHMRSLTFHTIL